MTPRRKKRLYMVLTILTVCAISAALVLYAFRSNINLFFTPAQIAAGEAPTATTMRIAGMVKNNSIIRSDSDLNIRFTLTDEVHNIVVDYTGIVPNLFREGQGIVVRGQLIDGIFQAEQLLAKHDENYMPPEVAKAMQEAHKKAQPKNETKAVNEGKSY